MKRTQNKASEFTLSKKQIQQLILAASKEYQGLRNRTIIEALYYGALRRSEVAALDIRDLDLEKALLYVRSGKGDKERVVPICAPLLSDLTLLVKDPAHYRIHRTSGPVFVSRNYRYPTPHRAIGQLHPITINTIVGQAGKNAGLTNPNPRRSRINPHLLRHSFARHYLDAGGSLRVLSHILGHSSISITGDVYGTPSVEFVEAEYKRIMEQGG